MDQQPQPAKRILFTDQSQYALTTIDGKVTLAGYCIVWNVLSSDRGGYFVKLLPYSAQFADVTFALYNHDYSQPLARTDDGTLRIRPDEYGVKVEIDLPDTQTARDLATLVGRGTIRGMSFAMVPGGDSFETTEDDKQIVTFKRFEADEVTITAIPAFDETSIAVKAATQVSSLLEDCTKELATQFAKIEQYKLDMYRF